MGKELKQFEPNALQARSKDPPCFALKLPAAYLEAEASPWSRYTVACWDLREGVRADRSLDRVKSGGQGDSDWCASEGGGTEQLLCLGRRFCFNEEGATPESF